MKNLNKSRRAYLKNSISLVLLGCLVAIVTCTDSKDKTDSPVKGSDTIVTGYSLNFKPYSQENTSRPMLNFRYSDGNDADMHLKNDTLVFPIDEAKPMVVKLIGFKDSSKYIPIIVRGEGLRMDSVSGMKDFYRVTFLKDTVDVQFILDCGHGKIKLLHYPREDDTTTILRDSADTYKVAYGKFVKLNK